LDDGRIPIDITEEHAAAEADARSYVREDGTLVIEIPVEQPCGASSEREIVVCASDGAENRLERTPAPPAEEGLRPEVQLGENAKADLRATPGRDGAVQAMVTLTIKF
jgi:hypothetical protein